MDILGTILWPLRWLIEMILVAAHWAWSMLGLDADNGWTWILSILVLVIVVRSAMIPIMLKQIKSMRGMMELQPELKKIQDKYKGKKDQFSRQAMQQETMALYQRNGSSPMASCWPMLVQLPIFFALYSTIQAATQNHAGVGMMTQQLSQSLASGEVFGAPLHATLINNGGNTTVVVLAIVIIVLMVSSQFFTQFQITAQNVSDAAKQSPMYRQQQMLMYVMPLLFAVSGLMFPLMLMMYWLITNVWTMGQQWWTIRNMPTPGSDAARSREDRLKAKGKWDTHPDNPANRKKPGAAPEAPPQQGQRQQPMSKSRAKKQQPKKPGGGETGSAKPDAGKPGSK